MTFLDLNIKFPVWAVSFIWDSERKALDVDGIQTGGIIGCIPFNYMRIDVLKCHYF